MQTSNISIKAFIENQNYRTIVTDGNHSIVIDEPQTLGGTDMGMTPKQMLGGSLASCTVITLKMYADRKQWKTNSISVEIDCTDLYADVPVMRTYLKIDGELDQKQMDRMLVIAKKCPVHKVLARGTQIETILVSELP